MHPPLFFLERARNAEQRRGNNLIVYICIYYCATHVAGSNVKYSLQEVQASFKQISIFSTDFQTNAQYQTSRKSVQWQPR
jgi:hypothetical protein